MAPIRQHTPVTAEELNPTTRAVSAVAGLGVDVANTNVVDAGTAGDSLRVAELLVRDTRFITHAEVGMKIDRVLIYKQT